MNEIQIGLGYAHKIVLPERWEGAVFSSRIRMAPMDPGIPFLIGDKSNESPPHILVMLSASETSILHPGIYIWDVAAQIGGTLRVLVNGQLKVNNWLFPLRYSDPVPEETIAKVVADLRKTLKVCE